MKIYKPILILSLIVVLLYVSFSISFSYTAGIPPGYTGSPVDGATCATISCHQGIPIDRTGWISSDVPITGFVPDSVYSFTATASRFGVSKFGFQISVIDKTSNFAGDLLISDSIGTQYSSMDKYITHTNNGVNGNNGSKTWNFKWKAPSNSNEVTFFGAFVAGDSLDNDSTYISNLELYSVSQNINRSLPSNNSFLKVFPNPVSSKSKIEFFIAKEDNVELNVYNIFGKEIFVLIKGTMRAGFHKTEFDVNSLSKGVYFYKLQSGKNIELQKVIVI